MTIAERPDVVGRLRPRDATSAAERSPGRRRNVIAEIAERRRADVRAEMARLSLDDHLALPPRRRRPATCSEGLPRRDST